MGRGRLRSARRFPVGATATSRRYRPKQRPGLDVVPAVLAVDAAAMVIATRVADLSPESSVLMLVLVLCFNAVGGHYRARLAATLLDEAPSLAGRALVAGAIVTAVRILMDWPVRDGPVSVAVLFLALAMLGRAVGYPLMRRGRVNGRIERPTIIVGCGQVGGQLAQTLLEHPEYGLEPVGFVDDSPLLAAEQRRIPLLGDTAALSDLLLEHRVRNVIVAFSSSQEPVIVDVLRTCDRMACETFLPSRFFELHGAGRDHGLVWSLPIVRLRRVAYRTETWRLKRASDAVVALVLMVALAPVFAACALAVRLEGGPGVIFRQERVRLDGRPFTMLKFRSLQPTDEHESASNWSIEGDERLGRVGRFLRSTSLDELPQPWNVLRASGALQREARDVL